MSSPLSESGHDKLARRFFRQRHIELLEGLNLDEINVHLYANEVLDAKTQEKVMNTSLGSRTRLEELLIYLTRQGEPGLLALIGALKNCRGDPSQAKLGLDLEQQWQMFLTTSHSTGSTGSSTFSRGMASSSGSKRVSDVEELDSCPKAPFHVGVVKWMSQNPKYIKIVVIGPPECGKTSLMLRYTQGHFDILMPRSVSSVYDGIEYMLEFHDTPGHNRYDSIVTQYWRNTHGAIVVYDITDHQSLEHALEWKRHLDNSVIQRDGSYIPAVLVGNKNDKADQAKQVYNASSEIWKRYGFVEFFPTSVKTKYNVIESVEFLVKKILEIGIPDIHYLPDRRRTPKVEQIADVPCEPTKCC